MCELDLQNISKHFQLNQLADGIYAAIAATDGLAMGNAGMIDLGDRVILFDTFLNLEAARELRSLAESLTGRPVTDVVISHSHLDHVIGNQLFDETVRIYSSPVTYQELQQELPNAYRQMKEQGAAKLAHLEHLYATVTDRKALAEIANGLVFYRSLAGQVLQIRLPDTFVSDRLTLQGTARKAELITTAMGHTAGDLYLYLPDEKILFAGDLICVANHPWLGNSDLAVLQNLIRDFTALELQSIVPGHGPVGGSDSLQLLAQYIDELQAVAQRLLQDGKTPADAEISQLSSVYHSWDSAVCFGWNVGSLFGRATAQDHGTQ